jgi:hypothetical protein
MRTEKKMLLMNLIAHTSRIIPTIERQGVLVLSKTAHSCSTLGNHSSAQMIDRYNRHRFTISTDV